MNGSLHYDGLLAAKMGGSAEESDLTPNDIRGMRAYVEENRPRGAPFEIACEGETPGATRRGLPP